MNLQSVLQFWLMVHGLAWRDWSGCSCSSPRLVQVLLLAVEAILDPNLSTRKKVKGNE